MIYNVGSYNVERFGAALKETPERRQERITAVRTTLTELAVDTLTLQEVSNAGDLDEVLDCKELKEKFPHVTFLPTDEVWGANEAVLSRYPIGKFELQAEQVRKKPLAQESRETATDSTSPSPGSHPRRLSRPFPTRKFVHTFVRPLAIVDVQVGQYPTKLYVHHGKANPYHELANQPDFDLKMRKAQLHREHELKAMTTILDEDAKAYPGSRQIVAGDFNADAETPEMQSFLAGRFKDSMRGSSAITHPATGKRVDFVLTDKEGQARVHDTAAARLASDHLPVVLAMELCGPISA